MEHEYRWCMATADADPDVGVIVITGAGRGFCAGADLSSGGGTFSSSDERSLQRGERPVTQFVVPWMIRKPTIAAINGPAVGVGITYPLQCDVRFVAEEAKISFAFVRRGVMPELAAHAILPRVIGVSKAADLLLSGRMITGREAYELGLASRVLPAADVLAAAQEWARDVAVNTAPVSVAVAKRLIWDGLTMSPAEMLKREGPLFGHLGNSADAAEGIQSFLEKRAPEWKLSAANDLPPGL
jgi:enoyl-CoA hydratase/carnithine racemase